MSEIVMNLVKRMRSELPLMFSINEATKLTGGVVHSGTLRNRMREGTGPKTVKFGRRIAIPRDEFITWMEGELETRQTA